MYSSIYVGQPLSGNNIQVLEKKRHGVNVYSVPNDKSAQFIRTLDEKNKKYSKIAYFSNIIAMGCTGLIAGHITEKYTKKFIYNMLGCFAGFIPGLILSVCALNAYYKNQKNNLLKSFNAQQIR